MTVKAKFTVTQVTHYEGTGAHITLEPRYDKTIPEDQRFHDATPTGKFEMYVSNRAVIDEMRPGKVYYVEFTAAPAGTTPYHE